MESNIKQVSFEQIKKEVQALDTDTVLLITDHTVWSIYGKQLELERLDGKKVILWKAPDGEKVKNLREYETCVEFFLEKGIHRNAHLVALGGGATSDMAGYVAATILRGIAWSIIPTTLLSMIDASIGGKVGINSKIGKNLIGAFHAPTNIWMNDDFLESLPKNEMQSGKGELIKYAFLDIEIFNEVKRGAPLSELIRLCYTYKANLVKADYKETGMRKLLNFGHTFGHAIEKNYSLTHGLSVYCGIALIFKLFGEDRMLAELKQMRSILRMDGIIAPWLNREFPAFNIMEYVKKDKKLSSNDVLDLILIEEIGHPIIKSFPLSEVSAILEGKKHELKHFNL